MRIDRTIFIPLILAIMANSAAADEGMWTFDNFPMEKVASDYGARVDRQWLDRIRLGTVRLAGCTASFVSPNGLILTNHHCVTGCLAEHSSRESSLLETGFFSQNRNEELECSAQIADVLIDMQDVTSVVQEHTAGLTTTAANDARKRLLTELEQECEETNHDRFPDSQHKCESVTLYDGGQYFIYTYRRYDDVRLVLAPEAAIAAFGGDPDNFQFPRWCLDFSFLRAYEDGIPAVTPNHLTIDFDGPDEGDLIFIAGHPGSTDRQLTVAQLKTIRDVSLPPTLLRSAELRGRYIEFARQGEQQARIVRQPLFGLENGIKVRRKLLDALHDDDMLAAKLDEELALQAWLEERPDLKAKVGDPWEQIAAAQETARNLSLPYTMIERMAGFNSRMLRYARTLVRGAAERDKPNTERLPEYAEASLARVEQRLVSRAPVYPELEELTLSFSLARMREWLGPDHAIVRNLTANESPEQLAHRLVTGSELADPEVRRSIWNGGIAAIQASSDPMILLARDIDGQALALRKRYEDEVEAPVTSATESIAKIRFAAFGTAVYPDATFTLRLNYGTVTGWDENGMAVEPFTRLARLFERATGQEPFAVPASWATKRDTLDMRTPFNLSTNGDIVGGNSGSPLIDSTGNVVGVLFDGNIHSISGAYWFDAEKNRAIAVHAAIIREALSKVYDANALLAELAQR